MVARTTYSPVRSGEVSVAHEVVWHGSRRTGERSPHISPFGWAAAARRHDAGRRGGLGRSPHGRRPGRRGAHRQRLAVAVTSPTDAAGARTGHGRSRADVVRLVLHELGADPRR